LKIKKLSSCKNYKNHVYNLHTNKKSTHKKGLFIMNEEKDFQKIKHIIKENIYCFCPDKLIEFLRDENSEDFINAFYNIEDEENPIEIFEYYLVSDWFGRHALALNLPVMFLENRFWIWGRTETGVSLEYDDAIPAIIERSDQVFQEYLRNR
jgi:hypothetical protein